MKIAITGASGFVGSHLSVHFLENGWDVVPLRRQDLQDEELLLEKIAGCDVLINLAGAPIVKKWTEAYKKELYASRIETTRKVVNAIKRMHMKPKLLISTSAIGIYDNQSTYDESHKEYATDFLGKVTQDWEKEALKAEEYGIRVAILRFGLVLGKNGGMMGQLLTPFKLGLGGPVGDGSQHFSWIHLDDIRGAMEYIISYEEMRGIYNMTSPEPTTNLEFSKMLGKVLKRPAFLPVPVFVLKILFGEGAQVMADGQSVVPKRLMDAGYGFKYPTLQEALEEIVN